MFQFCLRFLKNSFLVNCWLSFFCIKRNILLIIMYLYILISRWKICLHLSKTQICVSKKPFLSATAWRISLSLIWHSCSPFRNNRCEFIGANLFEVPTCKVAMLTLILFLHYLVLDNCTIVEYICQLYYVSSTVYEFWYFCIFARTIIELLQ